MSEAEARDFLVAALRFGRHELENAAAMRYPNTVEEIAALVSALPSSMPQALRDMVTNSAAMRRSVQAELVASGAKGVIAAALRFYGREINSPYADEIGPDLLADIRAAMLASGHYVTGRGNVPASDPTPGDGLFLRRLTVGHDGEAIDGGVHNETVTATVVQTGLTGQGPRQALVRLTGEDAGDDALDYRNSGTARVGALDLELYNEVKQSGVIGNANFIVGENPTNGTTVTQANLGSWTRLATEGAPTTVWRTSNLWRSLRGGIAHSGNATTTRYEQRLVLPTTTDATPSAYAPIDIRAVVYWDGTWQGKVRIYWGNKMYEVGHAAFSGAGFKYIVPPLDDDLYPLNFSTTDSKFAIEIETDSGSGELVLFNYDLQRMRARQGWWYSAWSHTLDPIEGATQTWVDTCTFTGPLQDSLQVFNSQAPWAYLPVTGSNLLSITYEAVIAAEYDDAPLANNATIDLGSVASGPHEVELVFANAGTGPLAISEPTTDNVTNASLTDDGFGGAPRALLPGDRETITLEVTDGGAGAFAIDVVFANNDADDNPFVVTISGTAT